MAPFHQLRRKDLAISTCGKQRVLAISKYGEHLGSDFLDVVTCSISVDEAAVVEAFVCFSLNECCRVMGIC